MPDLPKANKKTEVLKQATYRGGKIFFTDEGKGRALVLLHGFLGSHLIWKTIAPELAKRFRVIAINLPGHGGSDCYGYVHSMELLAGSVKAVMDELKLKKYVIIGHSMGGYAGLAFAELFPEHIRGLCLFHSTSYADSEEKKKDRNRAIRAVKANHNIYIKSTISNLFNQKAIRQHKDELKLAKKIASKTPRRSIVASLEGMKDRKSRDILLHFAKFPIQFIIGKYDSVLPMQVLLNQSEIPNRKHVLILENSGHMGMLEEPKLCIKPLVRFIRDCFSRYREGQLR